MPITLWEIYLNINAQKTVLNNFSLVDSDCNPVVFPDFVFKMPPMREGCRDPFHCPPTPGAIVHEFDNTIRGSRHIKVTCAQPNEPSTIPMWTYEFQGKEIWNHVPACTDPTYCDERPPPRPDTNNVKYDFPADWNETYKFMDGKSITYTCAKDGTC